MSTGVDNGQTPPSPFPTLRPHAPRAAADRRASEQQPPVPSAPPAVPETGAPPRPSGPPPPPEAVPAPGREPDVPPIPPAVPVTGRPPAAPPPPATPPPPPAAPVPRPAPPAPGPPTGPAPYATAPGAVPYAAAQIPPAPPLEPPPPARTGRRRVGPAVCLVLGLGLIAGATAGTVINHGPRQPRPVADGSVEAFATARNVWRNTPVDQLFPPTYTEKGGGPGGADRSWTRIGVAPPAGCAGAFDAPLQRTLAPVGCVRLLRATYLDSTSTTVTTVGLLVTAGEAPAMTALNLRWDRDELGLRTDLIPKAVAFPRTAAAGFGDHQRGSWAVQVSADLPFVVYAVSGFADGRAVTAPQPAQKADVQGATTATAQAGLGFDVTGLASAVDDRLHAAVTAELHPATARETHG
ncbi:hypothetical protein ACFO3J_11895 [Streptomyces polygonati]|uniref:Uncharacterized protein n=1 Tax=Streptomyces polygonati TaxID=1617087 RepID=A0ABV8HKP4_9ACTN